MIEIINVDWINIRNDRQKLNNILVYNSIINNDIKLFNSLINIKELNRILDDINLTKEELIDKCKNDIILGKITAGRISKNASRQSNNDEAYQFNICSMIANKTKKIIIKKLNVNDYRPTKDGNIISLHEMKNKDIKKDMCLKSFDGIIEGKIKGWIFCKSCIWFWWSSR